MKINGWIFAFVMGALSGYAVARFSNPKQSATKSPSVAQCAPAEAPAAIAALSPAPAAPKTAKSSRAPASTPSEALNMIAQAFHQLSYRNQIALCSSTARTLETNMNDYLDEAASEKAMAEIQKNAEKSEHWYGEYTATQFSKPLHFGIFLEYHSQQAMQQGRQEEDPSADGDDASFTLCYTMVITVLDQKGSALGGAHACSDEISAKDDIPAQLITPAVNPMIGVFAVPFPPYQKFRLMNLKTNAWDSGDMTWTAVSDADLPKYRKLFENK